MVERHEAKKRNAKPQVAADGEGKAGRTGSSSSALTTVEPPSAATEPPKPLALEFESWQF